MEREDTRSLYQVRRFNELRECFGEGFIDLLDIINRENRDLTDYEVVEKAYNLIPEACQDMDETYPDDRLRIAFEVYEQSKLTPQKDIFADPEDLAI